MTRTRSIWPWEHMDGCTSTVQPFKPVQDFDLCNKGKHLLTQHHSLCLVPAFCWFQLLHIGKGHKHLAFLPFDWVIDHAFSQVLLPEWHSSGLFKHSLHQDHSSPLLIRSIVSKRSSENMLHHSAMHESIHSLSFLPSFFLNFFKNHDTALNQHFYTTPLLPTSFAAV